MSAPSVTSRLLAAHLGVVAGDAVVFLQPPDAATPAAAVEAGARIHVVHRKLPAVLAIRDALALHGIAADVVRHAHGALGLPPDLQADVVVIAAPEERVAWQQLLHDAIACLRVGGRLLVAGANDAGIKPAARLVAEHVAVPRTLGHGGGQRVFEAVRPAEANLAALRALVAPYDDRDVMRELTVDIAGASARVFTRPGVFSWDHLDEASALLASVMTPADDTDVLDLGCGAGVLGVAVGRHAPRARVTLVDADSEAVRCAQRTMEASGHAAWRVLASDVTSAVRDARFDLVVSNPPFHAGKQVDLELPRRFVTEAHAVLRPGGRLQLVANRTLPYEGELARVFGNRRTLHDGARFKVLEAVRG